MQRTSYFSTRDYLLNIGPRPDGSIPEESVKIMTQVGKWMDKSGIAIYQSEVTQPRRSNFATFTRTSGRATRWRWAAS
jgi:alpha-L-fucosidase